MPEKSSSESPESSETPAKTNEPPRRGIGGFFRDIGDGVVGGVESVGDTIKEKTTKDEFKESFEESLSHFQSILHNLKLRDFVADHVISDDHKGFLARFSSEYEMKYFFITMSYMSRISPDKLNAIVKEETGKDLHELVTRVKIEMPNGAKKTLKELVVEYESTKQ